MLPERVSNPGPLTYESGALPIALCSLATGAWHALYAMLLLNYKRDDAMIDTIATLELKFFQENLQSFSNKQLFPVDLIPCCRIFFPLTSVAKCLVCF